MHAGREAVGVYSSKIAGNYCFLPKNTNLGRAYS